MTGERGAPKNQSGTGGHQSSPSRSESRRNRVNSNGGAAPEQERHRVLRELRGELARHPAVRTVNGESPTEYRALQATVDPSWFGHGTETASLRVRWSPNPSPDPETPDRTTDTWKRTPIRAYYTLHYSEPSGLDCGFHCEPNSHVDGLLHYQERADANDAYTYDPVSFGARSVSGLLWEMMDALADRLSNSD